MKQSDGISPLEKLKAAREIQQVEKLLQRLLDVCVGATGALVATADGFVVARVFKQDIADKSLAAITSSVMSLAEALVNETGQGPCQNLIIEGQEGHVVSLRINHTRVLTAMATRNTRLGMLLSAAKACAEQLASTLGEK
jgi:predicted regulator of Ras-like GTPase activity (Roadblock/LC7/MglB family)